MTSNNLTALLTNLDEAAKAATAPVSSGRIVFAIDATGSREPSWNAARAVQSQMFAEAAKFGNLSLQLVYFGGDHCRASKFTSSPDVLAGLMNSIHCDFGNTQLRKVLARTLEEQEKAPLAAFIYISDAQEEGEAELKSLAAKLRCPGFFFQEGDDRYVTSTFKDLATLTKGGFAYFNSAAPGTLSELLKAVAAFATGGVRALRAQGTTAATLLLSQMNK